MSNPVFVFIRKENSYFNIFRYLIFNFKGEKIEKVYDGEFGEIVEIINKKGPVVKVGNGGIILTEVKFEGKKIQKGTDIINGRKLLLGDKLM